MQLSLAFRLVDPWDTLGEPRGTQGWMVQFGTYFFLAWEGSCLILDTTPLDHRDISRGYIDIPTGFVRGSVTGKCFTWYHGRCVKMSKKHAKNLDTSVFCQWKVNIIPWSDEKRLKKFAVLFLTTDKRYHIIGVRTFPIERLLVIKFMPFTQGLWTVFGSHEKQFPGCVPGVVPRGSKWWAALVIEQ